VNSSPESALTHLPEPEPPVTFSRSVMARVSRSAKEQRWARPVRVSPTSGSRSLLVGRALELAFRVAAIGGFAIVTISWTYGMLVNGAGLQLVPSAPWLSTPLRMPPGGPGTIGLALGLLLFVAGLFAPLRQRP
jgi:hypothetical protein